MIRCCKLKKSDIVLDVGTGTGVVAKEIASKVDRIIGIDISVAMLKKGGASGIGNNGEYYVLRGDIREKIFTENLFDKIIIRLVLHHILTGLDRAMQECYRILKPGGLLVISEGVPPSRRTKKRYMEIFKLKEKRRVFLDNDLIALVKRAGFKIVKTDTLILKNMSIKSWLKNSNVPEHVRNRIFNLHKTAPKSFWEDYDMKYRDGDLFINMKKFIVVGAK